MGPNGLVMIAQKVERIEDFNEVTFHFLIVIRHFSAMSSSSSGVSDTINEIILHYFDTTADDYNGVEINSLFKIFPQFTADAIKSSLHFLLNEGHLYTTIDENHMRSVNKGI